MTTKYYEGLRVTRGRDWGQGEEDGGEGFLGTVTQLLDNHTVCVTWDMGLESTCSTGRDGKFELRVFDSAPAGVRHPSTCCASCGKKDIFGMLWRCLDCAGCDLCALCYVDDKHNTRHKFLRIDVPGSKGCPIPKRKTSVRIRAIGIHPGAKVVRGKHWNWEDQDGGEGSQGEVKGFENISDACSRNLVQVEWPSGKTNSYRLGFQGKVDLKCVEEQVGPHYYRDHLPLLDTTDTSSLITRSDNNKGAAASNLQQILDTHSAKDDTPPPTTTTQAEASPGPEPIACSSGSDQVTHSSAGEAAAISPSKEETTTETEIEDVCFRPGDRVAIKVGEEKLKELQRQSGGVTSTMIKCIGRTGEAIDATESFIVVRFETRSKVKYRFNPQALIKVECEFMEQDLVRIRGDYELLRVLNSRMSLSPNIHKTLNKVGRVKRVDDDGNLQVVFKDRQYRYAPACCILAPGCQIDTIIDGSSSSASAKSDDTRENLHMFEVLRSMHSGGSSSSSSSGYLFFAIGEGAATEVRRVCEQDSSKVNAEYQDLTPLMYASLEGKRNVIRTLLDLGADVNQVSTADRNKTPISAAIEGKDPSVIEELLQHGADTSYTYRHEQSAVHLCVVRNQSVTLRALAKHGADMNTRNIAGDAPLHQAVEMKRHDAMEALVSLPQVDMHKVDGHSFNSIHLACLRGNPRALERLLARDSSRVNAKRKKSAALHMAAGDDQVECIRLLVINGGADINLQDDRGLTALHIACAKTMFSTVEALLEMGAKTNIYDRDRDTPLHLVLGSKISGYGKSDSAEVEIAYRVQIANMLISAGAYVDARDKHGRHPFEYGYPRVREGVKTFLKNNRSIIQWENKALGKTAFLTSDGSGDGHGLLKTALKGVGLPCARCDAPKSQITLYPCQHKCVCTQCKDKISRCPLCDDEVKDKVFTGEDG